MVRTQEVAEAPKIVQDALLDHTEALAARQAIKSALQLPLQATHNVSSRHIHRFSLKPETIPTEFHKYSRISCALNLHQGHSSQSHEHSNDKSTSMCIIVAWTHVSRPSVS